MYNPININDLEVCAMEFYAKRDYCNAIKILNIATEIESRTKNNIMLALNYIRVFRFDVAKEYLNSAYKVENNSSVYLFLGYIAILESDYCESISFLEKYISTNRNSFLGFLLYGIACYHQEKFNIAIKYLDEADTISNHECAAVCLYKAKTYLRKGNLDHALYYNLKKDNYEVINSRNTRIIKNLFEEIYIF